MTSGNHESVDKKTEMRETDETLPILVQHSYLVIGTRRVCQQDTSPASIPRSPTCAPEVKITGPDIPKMFNRSTCRVVQEEVDVCVCFDATCT